MSYLLNLATVFPAVVSALLTTLVTFSFTMFWMAVVSAGGVQVVGRLVDLILHDGGDLTAAGGVHTVGDAPQNALQLQGHVGADAGGGRVILPVLRHFAADHVLGLSGHLGGEHQQILAGAAVGVEILGQILGQGHLGVVDPIAAQVVADQVRAEGDAHGGHIGRAGERILQDGAGFAVGELVEQAVHLGSGGVVAQEGVAVPVEGSSLYSWFWSLTR